MASNMICGLGFQPGVTYAMVSGQWIQCGADQKGNYLFVQVATVDEASAPQTEQPVPGGEIVGLQIGMAVMGLAAVAWCIRSIVDLINSSGDA